MDKLLERYKRRKNDIETILSQKSIKGAELLDIHTIKNILNQAYILGQVSIIDENILNKKGV